MWKIRYMMDPTAPSPIEPQDTGVLPNPDPVYIRHVTELGEKVEIRAAEDICNERGLKLVARGTRIGRSVFDRLVEHKLLKPIDGSIGVTEPLSGAALQAAARAMLAEEPPLVAVLRQLPDPDRPLRMLARIPLPRALELKLLVLSNCTPSKFRHSLRTALISMTVGELLGRDESGLLELACGGLLHDIGELHIDPTPFESPGRPLSAENRRALYAHPIIGYLIVREFSVLHPAVSRLVLEHHERLDGSGYPKGLAADAISPGGRILALAEMATGICERGMTRDNACNELVTILKMQPGKFDAEAANALIGIYHRACGRPSGVPISTSAGEVGNLLAYLAEILAACPDKPLQDDPASMLVHVRLNEVRRRLARTGLDALDARDLVGPDMDGEYAKELHALAREALYQIKDIAHELERRYPDLPVSGNGAPATLWLEKVRRICGSSSQV